MKISSEYAVQMRNITKNFGACRALDDVSIDIKKVQFMQFWAKTAPEKQL